MSVNERGGAPSSQPASKADIAELFATAGLEALPATVFRSRCGRPSSGDLARILDTPGSAGALMVRTSAVRSDRNLPRAAGLDPEAAANWIAMLPPELDVIVQPYAPVIYSAEIAVYDDVVLAEVVPGIWELDNTAVPVRLLLEDWLDGSDDILRLSWPIHAQQAHFHDPTRGYGVCEIGAQIWQVAEVVAWLRRHRAGVDTVRKAYAGRPIGLKVHHAVGFGLSPQNVRCDLPRDPQDLEFDDRDDYGDDHRPYALMDDPCGPIPDGRLVLDVAIAREDHRTLVTLITRLRRAGVETVWLRSGLLSHLAITLREEGLEVRRVDERLLRR